MAFCKCDMSLKLGVAVALWYGFVILSPVSSGRGELMFS